MRADRLLIVADFLENLVEEKFYYGGVVSKWDSEQECPSVACVIGWTPMLFPEEVYWDKKTNGVRMLSDNTGDFIEIGRRLFEIAERDSLALFNPNSQKILGLQFEELQINAKPQDVARLIRRYVDSWV